MSSKAASPTASALRSSRLFSIPPPLQRSDTATSGLAGTRLSNSATTPWPSQQAITVPKSALAKGDWGMKRALPARSTAKTSTPSIRLHAIDTREHITDFDSASDHVRTLAKFQELRLPITHTAYRDSEGVRYKSVFEPHDDNTDGNVPAEDPTTQQRTSRWKHSSPDLGRVDERKFQGFIEGTVRSKRSAFLDFMRQKAVAHYEQERIREARHSGSAGEESTPITEITDDQFDEFTRQLRTAFVGASRGEQTGTTSQLADLVQQFLDIPGATKSHVSDYMTDMVASSRPPMHGSAGLGYLRTDAILANNPIFGPQARVAPQPARILSYNQNAGPSDKVGSRERERVGLAGFVVQSKFDDGRSETTTRIHTFMPSDEEIESAAREARPDPQRDFKTEGVYVRGGNRYWAEPRSAQLNSEGHVVISARNAPERNVLAATMDPTLGGRYTEEEAARRTTGADAMSAAARPSGELGSENFGQPQSASTNVSPDGGMFGLGQLRRNESGRPSRQPEDRDMGDEELDGSPLLPRKGR